MALSFHLYPTFLLAVAFWFYSCPFFFFFSRFVFLIFWSSSSPSTSSPHSMSGINDEDTGPVPSRTSYSPSDHPKSPAVSSSAKTRMHHDAPGPSDGPDFSLSSSFSPPEGLLQDPLFPGESTEHPDDMQKKDPLATQIWKLYSRTKAQLPNQERMENLTWRMMAMNLKRKERDSARQAR